MDDEIDSKGHLKGFNNMSNLLKKNGIFYFSVPIGNQRIEFNAHRIFSIKYLKDMFDKIFKIISFSYINDSGKFFENVNIKEGIKNNFNCDCGCGLFVLKKL